MVNQSPDRSVTPARVLVPVGFLLGLLAAGFLPYAGVSCGVGVEGYVRVCYPGWRMVSGTPEIATPNAIVPTDMVTSLQHAATLPVGIRLLAVLTALVLLVGGLSGLLPGPYRRAALGTAAAAVGLVLLVVTATLAAARAGDAYVYVDAHWYARLGVGDGAGVAGGFWLAFVVVAVLGATVLRSLLSLRYEAYFRTPGTDRLQPQRPEHLPRPNAASDHREDDAPPSRPEDVAQGDAGDEDTRTDQLLDELGAIARSRGFLRTEGGGDPRTREIGAELYEMNGMQKMLDVHRVVGAELGRLHARELEAAWHGIGSWQG